MNEKLVQVEIVGNKTIKLHTWVIKDIGISRKKKN